MGLSKAFCRAASPSRVPSQLSTTSGGRLISFLVWRARDCEENGMLNVGQSPIVQFSMEPRRYYSAWVRTCVVVHIREILNEVNRGEPYSGARGEIL